MNTKDLLAAVFKHGAATVISVLVVVWMTARLSGDVEQTKAEVTLTRVAIDTHVTATLDLMASQRTIVALMRQVCLNTATDTASRRECAR